MKHSGKPKYVPDWKNDLAATLTAIGFKDIEDSDQFSLVEKSGGVPLHQLCTAIAALRSREAIGYLLQLFARHDRSVLFAAANALSGIRSKTATRPLLRILRSSRTIDQRLAAIYALGNLADARSATTLMRLAVDKSQPSAVRDFSVEAMATVVRNRSRVVEVLLQALKDDSASVRWSAAWALGGSEAPRVIPYLSELVDDREASPGNTEVGEAAREAIEDIKASLREPSGRFKKPFRSRSPKN